MSDLNVTVSLLLENQSEIARELERAGGIAGKDFGNGLTGETKKSFDALIAAADKAAKEVGLKFNKQKLQFETVSGGGVPIEVLQRTEKLAPAFQRAFQAVEQFKNSLGGIGKVDSIANLQSKLDTLKGKQLQVDVNSREFAELQKQIVQVEKELTKIGNKRILISADGNSVLALTARIQERIENLRDKRLRVDVGSSDFADLGKQIAKAESELQKLGNKQVFIDIDSRSLQALQLKLQELQTKQSKVSVDSSDFTRLQREIDVVQADIKKAENTKISLSVDTNSLQGLQTRLQELQAKQSKVSVDSSDFRRFETEIDGVKEKLSKIKQERILLNVDSNSLSALIAKAENDLNRLRQQKVSIDIKSPDFKDLSAKVNQAERELNKLQQEAGNVSGFNVLDAAVQGVAFSITNTLTNAVGTGLASLRGMLSGFIELDGELRLAAAAAGETGGYERLGAVVQKVGIEAAGTTKQVAELATSLVRAGFSISEVEDALPGVVRGAEATGTGFEQFGDVVGNTLRAFALEASEVGRVTDVITKTVNSTNAQVEDLAYTFNYSAPLAQSLGISLEDLASAAGLLANAGIKGSVAGTGLREALQRLSQAAGGASPELLGLSRNQERLAEAMKRLGTSVVDAKGDLLPLDEVFIRLKRGMSELSRADQVQLANVLFGDQAGNKVLAILGQTEEKIKQTFGEIKNSQGATDAARTAMAGFGLELLRLQGTIDAIGNSVGQTFAAGLGPLLAIANQAAGAISGLPEPIKVAASLLIGLGTAAAAASIGIAALKLAMNQAAFATFAGDVLRAGAAISGPFAASSIIILAIGAAAGLATGQFKNMDSTTKQLIGTVSALAVGLAVLRGGLIFTGVVAAITKIVEAYKAWTTSTNILTAAQAALAVLTGGTTGIARVALAAAAAAGTYAVLNNVIQETGQSTEQLSEEQRNLQSEIDSTKKMISEQQELGISTDAAEKRLAELESKKASLSEPLALSIEIDDAKKKYEQLSEQAKKAAEGGGKAAAQAQADAAKEWEKFLTAVQSGDGIDGFSESIRKGGEELKSLSDQIFKLTEKLVNTPLTATADRAEIEKQIASIQKLLDDKKLKLKLELEQNNIQEQITAINKKKAEAVGRGAGKDEINNIDKERERLILLQAKNQKELIGAQKEAAAVAREIVQTEQEKAAIIKTQSAETEARVARQVAAGEKTKSQAEEELRLAKLITLEEEKKLKLKELAAIPAAQQNSSRALELRNDIAGIDKSIADTQVQQREAALEREVSLIGTVKVEYEAYLTQLRAAGSITKDQYENELRYLERVAMEREKAVKVNQLGGIRDQNSKEALTLRKEIAELDKGIAENQIATANANYEKAVQEVELKKGALDLVAQQIALEQQAGDASKSRYEMELQYVQALLAFADARQQLIQSEFEVAKAFNSQALQAAEANLAAARNQKGPNSKINVANAEREVLRLKEQQKKLDIESKRATLSGLKDREQLEVRALELKQRMAVFDQQGRIAQAEINALKQRQVMIELQVKLKDPNLTADQKKAIAEQIELQGKAVRLSDYAVENERDRLNVLYDINRIERSTLAMNQQARRNSAYADYINAGGRYAGGPVDPRFKYTVNELGMESFLSATGVISWIHKPAYGTWSPPTRGVVIPAGLSQRLMESGALPPLPGANSRRKVGALTRVEQISQSVSMNVDNNMILAVQKQTLQLARLQRSIDKLVGKDWNVNVRTPSSAGILRTMQSLI